jgi:uncharacterized protein with PIN domain
MASKRKIFEDCTPEEQTERLREVKKVFDLVAGSMKHMKKRIPKDPVCPSCGGKLRYIGDVNKPDIMHVPFGGTTYYDGLYQCIKCKDVLMNPPLEYEA